MLPLHLDYNCGLNTSWPIACGAQIQSLTLTLHSDTDTEIQRQKEKLAVTPRPDPLRWHEALLTFSSEPVASLRRSPNEPLALATTRQPGTADSASSRYLGSLPRDSPSSLAPAATSESWCLSSESCSCAATPIPMGLKHREYLAVPATSTGGKVLGCKRCRTHLTTSEQIESKASRRHSSFSFGNVGSEGD